MTLVLGLETSSSESGVALCSDGSLLAEVEFRHEMSLLTQLPARIDELLHAGGAAMSDLGGVGVSSGPGSFTGLRIGVSAAKGIAYTLGIPIVGISTLEALARNASTSGMIVCPVIAWRKDTVFCAAYVGSAFEAVVPPGRREIAVFLAEIEALGAAAATLFLGSGAELHRAAIAPTFGADAIADASSGRPRARVVAQMAHEILAGRPKGDDIALLAPNYMQKTYVGTD
jgi:tRNA threonylcarbamoyladenosine biosynthesis protein TsaB